ncbi:MAG: rhodanese-like domain-containing protein [Planctomycetes bacterium]|nr:rhodanese-like domain-containing protein [Planctomycetota bacterium]
MMPRALLIAVAAAVLSGIHASLRPLTLASTRADPRSESTSPYSISLEATAAYFEDPDVIFIDASREDEYAGGHLPGAINLPLTRFARGAIPEELGYFSKNATVVVYCSSARCDAAHRVAEFMRTFGHEPVFVFHEGLEAWKRAGRPVEHP